MLKRLTIGSYRGLQNLTMEDLGRINIIIGENNSGKTSVLEAIQLFDYENVLSSLITIARKRETPLGIAGVHGKLDVFDSLFYSFDMKGEAKELAEKFVEEASEIQNKLKKDQNAKKAKVGCITNAMKPGKANQVSIADDDWVSEATLRECEMLKRLDEAVGKFVGE